MKSAGACAASSTAPASSPARPWRRAAAFAPSRDALPASARVSPSPRIRFRFAAADRYILRANTGQSTPWTVVLIMNQREPTSAPVGAGQALPCLALLLLPLLTAAQGWARPALSAPASSAKSYLVALGSPPLRFEEPAPPPDLVTRPPAAAPPQPTPGANVSDSAQPALEADALATTSTVAPATAAIVGTSPIDSVEVELDEPLPALIDDAPEPARTPPPILRDDLRPQIRPEDFLPYFQIPAPGTDATVIVPTPRTPNGTPLPPSSATYTQTPR